MLTTRIWGAVLPALLFAGGSEAQDDASVPLNRSGEEIFNGTYRPSQPAEEAVPLQPGRSSAGFQIPLSIPTSSAEASLDRSKLRLPGIERLGVPLLRNVRREHRFRRGRSHAPAAVQAVAAETVMADDAAPELKVHFVNVGQGAGAILEFPCHTALIDTGGEYATGADTLNGGELFAKYLDAFFDARPDRNRVVDLVITSHPHEDHLAGLKHISSATGADAYKVRNVVDNGQTHDKGSLVAQRAFRSWATSQMPKARYSYVNFKSAVTATAVTNGVIDPIGSCRGIDPVITVLWGDYNEKLNSGSRTG